MSLAYARFVYFDDAELPADDTRGSNVYMRPPPHVGVNYKPNQVIISTKSGCFPARACLILDRAHTPLWYAIAIWKWGRHCHWVIAVQALPGRGRAAAVIWGRWAMGYGGYTIWSRNPGRAPRQWRAALARPARFPWRNRPPTLRRSPGKTEIDSAPHRTQSGVHRPNIFPRADKCADSRPF